MEPMPSCPGLIPCTPSPTPGPVGLTGAELIGVGQVAGYTFIFIVVVLAIVMTILFLWTLMLMMRD
jgi:hypothetical protein